MLYWGFTLFTEIVIVANWAHVSNTLNGICITAIADKFFVKNLSLFQLLFSQVNLDLLSKWVSTHLSDLISNDFKHVSIHVTTNSSSSITFSTGKSFFVYLRPFALEAWDLFSIGIIHLKIIIRRHKKWAASFLVTVLYLHLATLINSLNSISAWRVFYLHTSLCAAVHHV